MNPEGYFYFFDCRKLITDSNILVYPREFIFQLWDFNSIGQSG